MIEPLFFSHFGMAVRESRRHCNDFLKPFKKNCGIYLLTRSGTLIVFNPHYFATIPPVLFETAFVWRSSNLRQKFQGELGYAFRVFEMRKMSYAGYRLQLGHAGIHQPAPRFLHHFL